MCVGFTNGFDDFGVSKHTEALAAMTPGSAISFNRLGYYHFAIFLGWAWPKGGDSEPVPLLCHLTGSPNDKAKASIRLDDVREVAKSSEIRVYQCTCSASRRSEVIFECLWKVGTVGYNLVTKNCEHFVREVICGSGVSYQIGATFAAPFIMVPRLIAGGAIGGALNTLKSPSLRGSDVTLDNYRSLGLINPEMDLIEIFVENHGLNLKAVKKNASCTREFAGSTHFALQKLTLCKTCSSESREVVCQSCLHLCHENCSVKSTHVGEDLCSSRTPRRKAVSLPSGEDFMPTVLSQRISIMRLCEGGHWFGNKRTLTMH